MHNSQSCLSASAMPKRKQLTEREKTTWLESPFLLSALASNSLRKICSQFAHKHTIYFVHKSVLSADSTASVLMCAKGMPQNKHIDTKLEAALNFITQQQVGLVCIATKNYLQTKLYNCSKAQKLRHEAPHPCEPQTPRGTFCPFPIVYRTVPHNACVNTSIN